MAEGSVTCPHCGHPYPVTQHAPGRYGPKCGECGEVFVLWISQEHVVLSARSLAELKAKLAVMTPDPTQMSGSSGSAEALRGGGSRSGGSAHSLPAFAAPATVFETPAPRSSMPERTDVAPPTPPVVREALAADRAIEDEGEAAVILPYRSGGFRSVQAMDVPTVGNTAADGPPDPTRAPSVPPPVNRTRLAPDGLHERAAQVTGAVPPGAQFPTFDSRDEVTAFAGEAPPAPPTSPRSLEVPQSRQAEVTAVAPRAAAPPPPAAADRFPSATAADGEATAPVDLGSPDDVASTHPTGPGPADAALRPSDPDELTGQVGGYQIIRRIGKGGMGSVYLARQISLDRNVALKTMNREWASDPAFLSRFVREAYAAAQLTHHHVVQIYDIGEDRGINFFTMEFVPGQSLGTMVRRSGPLDVEEVAGYILQAARGLKYAHDHGMVHRDIKPDNLILSEQGVIKVADLGLVKTPGAAEQSSIVRSAPVKDGIGGAGEQNGKAAAKQGDGTSDKRGGGAAETPARKLADSAMTRADMAMGTPAYMAPEQGIDAARVDARADVYSLGCTLYVMVTGRPVFTGKTSDEVMARHATEAPIPPEIISKRVPPTLSRIILKMIEKRPDDRYQTMDDVIADLEQFLGLSSTGPFSPGEAQAAALEDAVAQFASAPAASLRSQIRGGLALVCVLAILGAYMLGRPDVAGGLVGFAVMGTLSYLALFGWRRRSQLYLKVRELILGSPARDWLIGLLTVATLTALLYFFGLLAAWLAFSAAGLAVALALHLVLDAKVRQQRSEPLKRAELLLKSMRLRGVDEDVLRGFVCRYGGAHWEVFFEELFGYQAKLEAREKWGRTEQGRSRPRHAAWREPVIAWIEVKLRERETARQEAHLRKIERARLKAQGSSDSEASHGAEIAAATMITAASQLRSTLALHATLEAEQRVRSGTFVAPVSRIVYGDEDEEGRRRSHHRSRRLVARTLDRLAGGGVRLMLGLVLVLISGLWLHRRGAMGAEGSFLPGLFQPEKRPNPLVIPLPLIPENLLAPLCTYEAALAGLLLITTSFMGGFCMSLFMLPAAVLILGSRGMPGWFEGMAFGPISGPVAALLLGLLLVPLGLLFGRRRER